MEQSKEELANNTQTLLVNFETNSKKNDVIVHQDLHNQEEELKRRLDLKRGTFVLDKSQKTSFWATF